MCLALQGHVQGNVQRSQTPNEQQQQQQGVGATGFALQLVQRGLEESLGAVQRAIHEEVQNLHLELLRQFHIQQVGNFLISRVSVLIWSLVLRFKFMLGVRGDQLGRLLAGIITDIQFRCQICVVIILCAPGYFLIGNVN